MNKSSERQVWKWQNLLESSLSMATPQHNIRPRNQMCKAMVLESGVEPYSAKLCFRYCAGAALC